MARTILQIYDALIVEKEANATLSTFQPNIDSSQTLLSDLTTSSKVAAWRLIFFVCAVGIYTIEQLFDVHKAWVEARALTIMTGNLYWYEQRALEFQLGDPLVFDNGVFNYSPIVVANRVVNLASATESGQIIILKTAKYDLSMNIIPLSPTELSALVLYMRKRRIAGCALNVVSRTADDLRIYYKIYYDPLVIAPDGSLLTNPTAFPIEEAINEYCKGLLFDGLFSTTQLTDQLQNVTGCVNPVFQNADAKSGFGSYSPIIDYFNPNAGYFKIDPAYALNTTITYIAH